jgi:hypothetical protein
MTALSDPRNTACAIARVVAIRARSIADLGEQIAALPDPIAVKPEEYQVLINSFEVFTKELQAEVENFAFKANFAID